MAYLGVNKLKKGDKFGMLTVISWEESKKSWLCQCDCGGTTHARSYALKTGSHTRCSCGRNSLRPSAQLPDNLGIKRSLYRNYRKAAAKRGYEFSIGEENFFEIIEKNCTYCGQEPSMVHVYYKKAKERVFKYNGIDRIDNNTGYTEENCVPCCKVCNNSKSTLSLQEWKEWLTKVYRVTME